MVEIIIVATLGERLRQARQERGLTMEEAAELVGVQPTSIWRYENDYHMPPATIFRTLAEALRKPMEWFWDESKTVPASLLEVSNVLEVPVRGVVSAGGLVDAWEQDLGTIQVPANIVQDAPRAFALRVSGNSLASDMIFEGDIVVVDPDSAFVEGRIYAVRLEDQTIAARKLFASGSRKLKLITGTGEVLEVAKRDVTIIGRVCWSLRQH